MKLSHDSATPRSKPNWVTQVSMLLKHDEPVVEQPEQLQEPVTPRQTKTVSPKKTYDYRQKHHKKT